MNELHFAYKIRQYLNRGLRDLSPSTGDRLATARERALACQKVAVQQSMLAAAGTFVQQQIDGLNFRQIGLALAIAVGIATYTYWYADQSIAEIEAIDSALLADDLPIAAFTDRGFYTWLKSSGSQ